MSRLNERGAVCYDRPSFRWWDMELLARTQTHLEDWVGVTGSPGEAFSAEENPGLKTVFQSQLEIAAGARLHGLQHAVLAGNQMT